MDSMGPLQNGSSVAIIGGGPGGTACAIALLHQASALGRTIHVTIYEGKIFAEDTHHNQCAGVVSPPITDILENQLRVSFPFRLVQRKITGYVLHGNRRALVLDGPEDEPSYAMRRNEFDHYMLEQARQAGATIVRGRVTDLEFHADGVHIYSESDYRHVNVVAGAFGLDDGTAAVFARTTHYAQPRFLQSIVTKFHPPSEFMGPGVCRIHAFLPAAPQIEFGAITPKTNHVTINTAGAHLDTHWMETFLSSSGVHKAIPFPAGADSLDTLHLPYFKGRFPISIARNFYGNRYVLVGDAAGLVRAFKGKGINSACLSGIWAAQCMLRSGISRQAFADDYVKSCHAILIDLPYGKAVRQLVILGSRLGLVDRVIATAEREPALQQALFDAVSGHRNYRDIILDLLHIPLLWRLGRTFVTVPQPAG